tara:strand:- start:259 stop:726 length:468 start_codon:yes stop_codon:yes gene_type:complete
MPKFTIQEFQEHMILNNLYNTSKVFINNATLVAKTIHAEVLDLDSVVCLATNPLQFVGKQATPYNTIIFTGKCKKVSVGSTDVFAIFGSNDGTNYYKIQSVRPFTTNLTSEGTGTDQFYHFCYRLPLIGRYYKLGLTNDNTNSLTNFTCEINLVI